MKSNKTVLTIVAVAILALAVSAQADLLFYEGFEYTPGSSLAGLGTPGGGSGTWFDNSSGPHMTVRANGAPVSQNWTGIPSGGFPQTGGFLEGERTNDNSGHILLATSVTSTFQDGTTTWMSFVAGPALESGMNDNHHKPNLAIGQGELMDDRAQQANGQAIGGGARYNTQGLSAAYWDDETVPTDGTFEEHRSGTKGRITPQQLIVMKIEWGAASDTVSLANFDINTPYTTLTEADFDAASPVSITSVNNLDQSTFDTLSFHGSRSNFDEIRIATTFEDVVTGTTMIDLGEDPKNGSTVGIDRTDPLSWILPDPNDLVNGTVTCDVWFTDNYPEAGLFPGDPNFTNYATKIVGDPDPEAVQSVPIPVTLEKLKTYYWRIDTYDDSTDEDQPVIGPVFNFNTNNQMPGVELGEDIITWLTEGSVLVPLSGVITDDDGPDDPPSLQWYIDSEPVEGATTIDPATADTENIVATLTETGEYVLRLTADDGVDTGEAAVAITVYSDSCAAALGQGATLLQSDFNGDCVTDFADFAEFAGEWLDSVALQAL